MLQGKVPVYARRDDLDFISRTTTKLLLSLPNLKAIRKPLPGFRLEPSALFLSSS